jgi:hypothetical protein
VEVEQDAHIARRIRAAVVNHHLVDYGPIGEVHRRFDDALLPVDIVENRGLVIAEVEG